jgi:hypothetical protein
VAVVAAPLAIFAGTQTAVAGGDLYVPGTPLLDSVQNGPWTISQGDPTAAGCPYPQADLLPGYTPVSQTAPPNLAVYPAASTATSPYSPYVTVTPEPGPSGALPESPLVVILPVIALMLAVGVLVVTRKPHTPIPL